MRYLLAALAAMAFGCATTNSGSFASTNLDITIPLSEGSSVRAVLSPVQGVAPVCAKPGSLTVTTPASGPVSCSVVIPIAEPSVTAGYPCN